MFKWMQAGAANDMRCAVTLVETGGALVSLELAREPSTNIDESPGMRRIGFADEAGLVRVTLELRPCEGSVIGSVEAELANENAFGRQRTFAPEGAVELGLPAEEAPGRWMAVYQHKDWWTRPAFGTAWADVPARTLCLVCGGEGRYRQLLPVSGGAVRSDASGWSGGIALRLSSGRAGLTRIAATAFVCGEGDDPYALLGRHAAAAAEAVGHAGLLRTNKTYPPLLDRLGWCSWDAFYHQVNEEGLLQKAEELQALGVPTGWFMIDDGWSDVRDGRLAGFEANADKFPGGLRRTVDALKQRYGVPRVGVWHTIAGYWGGIDSGSEEARLYGRFLRANARGQLLPSPEPGEAFGFWHGWHGWLAAQGIDFVKVDSQSAVSNFWEGAYAYGEAAAAAHASLEASIALHFDGAVINCMGMSAESVWHRPRSAVSRSSDDFVPQEAHGFAEHALQNAYNSYWHGAFYWGDWDMFWSSHRDARAGALLRAISGGPVYVSDPPGQTDAALLRALAYRDGALLRCDRVAVPAPDCLLRDPTREGLPLKLWNTAGGAGVVALFRIDGAPDGDMAASVGPDDVPGLGGDRFALHEHGSGRAHIVRRGEALRMALAPGGSAIWTIAPLVDGFAPLGRLDKFAGSHAVLACRILPDRVIVRVREGGGPFGFVSDRPPRSVRANGADVEASCAGPGFYTVELPDGTGECCLELELTDAVAP